MEKLTTIYTLSHPETGEIRYIGKTVLPLKYRMTGHMWSSRNRKSYTANWIKQLTKQGLTPIIEELDVVATSQYEFWEKYYIEQFKAWGFRLTNLTQGGEGVLGRRLSEESISKMRNTKKSNPQKHWALGKKFTEEHLKNLSASHKGKPQPESSKQKLARLPGREIQCLYTGTVYISAVDAAKKRNTTPVAIIDHIRNGRHYKRLPQY